MPLNQQFFEAIRASLYTDGIPQSAVDALNVIMAEAERRSVCLDATAYIMATVYREAGHPMLCRREAGQGYGKPYGYPTGPYNQIYYGRGWCQLTGLANYTKFEKRLGIPLVKNPDLALNPVTCCTILFDGMCYGIFTGVGLPLYFTPGKVTPPGNWIEARRIVNGKDHAEEIAANALRFQAALTLAAKVPLTQVPANNPPTAPVRPPPVSSPPRGLFAEIRSWFGGKS